jgi:hypothetical protein
MTTPDQNVQSPWSGQAIFKGPLDRVLIRRLHSSGALFVANYIGLHAFGLAFGVETQAAEGEAVGTEEQRVTEMFVGEAGPNLFLFATDDPEGIVFDDAMLHDGLMKLSDGHLKLLRERCGAFMQDVSNALGERQLRREQEAADEAAEATMTGSQQRVTVKGGPLNDNQEDASREIEMPLPLPNQAAAIPAGGGSLVQAPQPVPATVGVYFLTGEAEYTWYGPGEERPSG